MIRATLKGLLGRKLRTALTAFAIVLGVAMVTGAYVVTDTMLGAANKLDADNSPARCHAALASGSLSASGPQIRIPSMAIS